MNQGKALERLILSLEKALANSPNVLVESPKKLPDRTTGKLREHDVVLTVTEGYHSFLIAIECRDVSRPITVSQVEGFWAKCQDTGIGQGIIVSTSGFYNTARTKADHLGIRCLDIEEAESFNWLLARGIQAITTRLLSNDWTFFPERDGVIEKGDFEVVDKEGNVATMATLTANAQRQLTNILPEIPEPVDEADVTVEFPSSNLVLRSRTTGETVPVKSASVKIRYSVTRELIPIRLVQYKDKGKDENLTDAAYVDLNLGDHSARMLIMYKEDEGGKVVIVPQEKNNVQ
jgi:hypothetical protein